jgi:hypothetical protein
VYYPKLDMSASAPHYEMAYAVHTAACTYLLDETGVCRWIVSQQGVVPSHVRQCIGAQFVACLDLQVEGGLVGSLVAGGRALFVGHTGENMVLLRTGEIQHVDDRRGSGPDTMPPPAALNPDLVERPAERYDEPARPHSAVPATSQYGKQGGMPYRAKPPSFGVVRRHGEEQTITIATRNEADTIKRSRWE